jgi:nucleoside-diphosphate-sugar epimerase
VRVTLLGGTGFIGHQVARRLVEAGADVSVIHRGQTPANLPGVRFLTADRHDPSTLRRALVAAAPEVLIDMIAYRGSDVDGLALALPTSLERLVVISSGDVYWTYGAFLGVRSSISAANALPPADPLPEDAPLREQLFPYRAQAKSSDDLLYEYDKILVEQTARAGAGVPVTILRLPMVYGPRDPQRRVAGVLERLRAGPSTLKLNAGEAEWRCTRGYVEDVAWAIQLAALDRRADGQIFNLGEPDALTQVEWVGAIAAAAEWTGTVLTDEAEPATMPANWRISLVVDSGRIRRMLGYTEPIGRREGLRRTTTAT